MPTPHTPFTEDTVSFNSPTIPSPAKTWYRIYGTLHVSGAPPPLVVLHGGPGACHNYMLSLSDLSNKYSIPVIFYDQIGNGQSTHFPEKKGDASFWTEDLFISELENLLSHLGVQGGFDILGHSWGGMIGAVFAIRRPKGLRRLVLADSLPDMGLWMESVNRLRARLPQEVQDVMRKCEDEEKTESKEYEEASMAFYSKFLCRLDPWPEELMKSLEWMMQTDPTVYLTTMGPSEFFIIGTYKDWTILDKLHRIDVPTLLLNGQHDEAQDSVVQPFFREISKAKWVTFADSAHMPHWEERERYMEVVGEFLTGK